MDSILVIEIVAAVLAVTGMVCMAKYLADTFFLPKEIVTAVTILDRDSRENADILLHILKKGVWRCANRNIKVIVDRSFAKDDELMQMIADVRAECYFVDVN